MIDGGIQLALFSLWPGLLAPLAIVVVVPADCTQVACKESSYSAQPVITPNVFHMWLGFVGVHICSPRFIKTFHGYIVGHSGTNEKKRKKKSPMIKKKIKCKWKIQSSQDHLNGLHRLDVCWQLQVVLFLKIDFFFI